MRACVVETSGISGALRVRSFCCLAITMDVVLQDVVLLYYAPWCGFCAGFAHVYLSLARYFRSAKDIVFARYTFLPVSHSSLCHSASLREAASTKIRFRQGRTLNISFQDKRFRKRSAMGIHSGQLPNDTLFPSTQARPTQG